MRSVIILVLGLALAASSAVPERKEPLPSIEEMAREMGIDLNMDKDFDIDLDLGLDLDMNLDIDFDQDLVMDMVEIPEMPQDGSMDIDEFGFVNLMLKFFINESKALGKYIVKQTERQLLKIFMYPFRRLEQLASDIEKRAVESEECVTRETVHVAGILESATLGFVSCGRNAAVDSVNIILSTKRAVLQLTVNGYEVYKQYRKCKATKNSVLHDICRVKLYAMATKYAVSGQKSLRTLIGLRRSVPAIATDATACTTQATENAVQGFADINASIDTCIATMLY